MVGVISAKFRTFAMQINFCDTSKFSFSGPVGGIFPFISGIF